MDHITEEKRVLQDQVNTLSSQVDKLKSELLKEQHIVRETKVLLYQFNYFNVQICPQLLNLKVTTLVLKYFVSCITVSVVIIIWEKK